MSHDHNHLNHATWECKYHVVFTPKYRKKVLSGHIRQHLGNCIPFTVGAVLYQSLWSPYERRSSYICEVTT
jgi:hypothetical protein